MSRLGEWFHRLLPFGGGGRGRAYRRSGASRTEVSSNPVRSFSISRWHLALSVLTVFLLAVALFVGWILTQARSMPIGEIVVLGHTANIEAEEIRILAETVGENRFGKLILGG